MDEKLKKLHGLSHAMDIVLKVLRILMIVGMSLLLVVAIVLYALPVNKLLGEMGGLIFTIPQEGASLPTPDLDSDTPAVVGELLDEMNDVLGELPAGSYSLSELGDSVTGSEGASVWSTLLGSIDWQRVVRIAATFVLLSLLIAGVLYAILLFAGKVFHAMRTQDSPFTRGNVKNLKVVGFLMIGYIGAKCLVSTIISAILLSALQSVSNVNVNFGLNISFADVVFTLVFFCLALVFDYGCTLQEQADTTL